MASRARRDILWIGVAASSALIAGVYYLRTNQPHMARIQGVIVALDAQTRTGTLACLHPKNGAQFEVAGTIAADCNIIIDGAPGRITDLAAGDSVEVSARVYPLSGSIVATNVRALHVRQQSAASEPGGS